MELQGGLPRFDQPEWNPEQQWMANTSLLMQMIDDWVDQDEDCGSRTPPMIIGEWSLESVSDLYAKTVQDLRALLIQSGIRSPVLQGCSPIFTGTISIQL